MKLLLNIESGSLNGRQFEVMDGFLTIGRGENCAVGFDLFQERNMFLRYKKILLQIQIAAVFLTFIN